MDSRTAAGHNLKAWTDMATRKRIRPRWRFLTNHAFVLVCVACTPDIRLREIAERARISERTARQIVGDLIEAGYLEAKRVGRRKLYGVHPNLPLRHPLLRDHQVVDLLRSVAESVEDQERSSSASSMV